MARESGTSASCPSGHDVDMTTPSELADISAAIHDEYFDIERLEHDADRAELRLPIFAGRRKKWWVIETDRPPEDPPPPPTGTLVVRNVTGISVEDKGDSAGTTSAVLNTRPVPASYGSPRTGPAK